MTTIRDMIASGDENNSKSYVHDTASARPRDPFARHIAKRIKEVEDATQLAAPDVFGEESFPDVNIVSEYIDRTLNDSPLIREYEDACLNDSVLLAELVDCARWSNDLSQGSTVPVPEHCRHRLYYVHNEHGIKEHASIPTQDTVSVNPSHREEHETDQSQESTTMSVSSESKHVEPANNPSSVSSRRFDGKKIIRSFYRMSVMAALIGIIVLFLRLPPEERQENLSRLRNIWTLFQSDKGAVEEAAACPKLPAKRTLDSGLDSRPGDTLSDGKLDIHGDFPLPPAPISMNSLPKEPQPEGIATSLPPVEEISLQPSFVIPGGKDLLQSSPEILR